ncbi:MAG: EAL domain-containing protein, partial [bacterium]
GYSNLMRLARLPIDAVKIDRSYLEGILTKDHKRNSLLDSLVGIAKNLDYTIIAEGVEQQEQADYLRSLGCHLMQGYLYGRPMSLEDLLHFDVRAKSTLITPH